MEILKIAILGIIGVLLATQFKAVKPEYALYVGLGVCILIFSRGLGILGSVLGQLRALEKYVDVGADYLSVLLKLMGITYICEFSASICRDAGHQAVATQMELLGRVAVMLAGLPILMAVIEQMEGFWR